MSTIKKYDPQKKKGITLSDNGAVYSKKSLKDFYILSKKELQAKRNPAYKYLIP